MIQALPYKLFILMIKALIKNLETELIRRIPIKKSAHPASRCHHKRYLYSQLNPGDLTAHRSSRLVLLHS